ncbi:MAG: lipoprotein-releasing ABC transporter permease subunit [Candidatus Puniceispirillaceae bacterium]
MIFKPVERLLAFRYLRARREEGFISVIAWFSFAGITLGVATLIIVMSVMNGFRTELINRILGLNGHIGVFSATAEPLTDYNRIALKLADLPNVIAATPQVQGQVMASSSSGQTGAVVRGVSWSDLAARKPLWDSLSQQAIAAFRDDKHILIGETMAFRLGLKIGDKLTLLSASGRTTAFGSIPTKRTFTIGGLFKVGMHEYDNSFIFIPLSEAQSFFHLPEAVSGIEVYSDAPLQIDMLRGAISITLGDSYRQFDWQERNKSFLNALNVERNVMFIILTLIILVAAFNIVSSMIMLVRSKNADIAVLRSMGASSAMVMRVFLITGASIGMIGTFVGTLLGLLFCWQIDAIKGFIEGLSGAELFSAEIYYLSKLPAIVNPAEVLNVVLMAFVLSLVASLYPAWRASHIAPAEVLRYE